MYMSQHKFCQLCCCLCMSVRTFDVAFMINIALAIRAYLALLTTTAILTSTISFLRHTILNYGKLNESNKEIGKIGSIIRGLTVPKRWFVHFYIFGLGWTLYWQQYARSPSSRLCVWMFLLHLIRRILECLFVEKQSTSRMHIGHYITGLSFYTCAGIGVWIDNVNATSEFQIIGVLLFIFASCEQYRHHLILASIDGYGIPSSRWFDCIACPHYTAEVLIYTSFQVMSGFRSITLYFILIWTVVNLGITAKETQKWGRIKFGKKWPDRWNMFPFIF